MVIGVEIRPIVIGPSGGILQLLKGILTTLFIEHNKDSFYLFTTIYNNSIFSELPENVQKITFPTFNFYQEVDRVCKEKNIDILFRSFPIADDLTYSLDQQIFMIPDLQHEKFPEFFEPEVLRQRRLEFNRALSRAGGIATLSKYTQKTIQEHPFTKCRNIFISGPALEHVYKPVPQEDLEPNEIKLIPKTSFFYFPANLWPHKNHRRVFLAFRKFLKETDAQMTFVLTGHPDGWSDLYKEFTDLPIVHFGYVSSAFVTYLMQNALSLVFFTLYEGFGIPVLEAFQAETPVICSNTTSLPEVGGDAVLYSDPTDVDEMASAMAKIYSNEQLRTSLISRGKKQLTKFTWQRSADNLYSACEQIKKNSRQKNIIRSSAAPAERPLVSIVTPSFNQGQFLKRTIESILNQDYPNIEYIVVDGGSEDNSVEILKSYGNRFEWISEPDNGQAHAINKGFSRAKGTVLAYLNSDDVLYPGAVRTAVDHFLQNPSCDAVYGKADYLDKNDNKIGVYNTDCYSFERNMHDCCICQPACFWLKRIADIVGKFDETLHYGMDYDFWLRIDRCGGKIMHIEDFLAGSRLYEENKTLSGRDAFYKEIFKICKKHGNHVSLNYFLGRWHYRLHEKHSIISSFIKLFPSLYEWHAKIDHLLFHSEKNTVHTLRDQIKPFLQPYLPKFFKSAVLQQHPKKVKGFYLDNWLAPHAIIKVPKKDKTYHLSGTVPIDMQLSIKNGGNVLQTHSLVAGRHENISINVNGSNDRILELIFSDSIRDPVPRDLSFHVQSTDIFAECDLW